MSYYYMCRGGIRGSAEKKGCDIMLAEDSLLSPSTMKTLSSIGKIWCVCRWDITTWPRNTSTSHAVQNI